ncbi:hypothetical protein Rsub_12634 [Raphidocelis subcapitata]|uniref:Uncharacterized protein n=1 Tax=Raphidocelis subcapitata TaxID=307507 RepID=A0A2V0PJG4_9CHLO|nr:hypothetical protein Rsub_12634 [Raphidocelis subcapitata]|eukprot:GBF99941.1 hypothetical protein Rsub_12634 [Raphidocelis subcapitata]
MVGVMEDAAAGTSSRGGSSSSRGRGSGGVRQSAADVHLRDVAAAGALLELKPPEAEAAYRRATAAHAQQNGLFAVATLLAQAARLSSQPGLPALGTLAAAGALLAVLSTQRAWTERPRAAAAAVAVVVLAADAAWLRDAAAADPPPLPATWGGLADALLVRSGAAVLAAHAALLSLPPRPRLALALAEAALIARGTTLRLARQLAAGPYAALLARLHAAAAAQLAALLAALAALPPAAAGGPPPDAGGGPPPAPCLPLAVVATCQVALGLIAPLWAALLWERRRRSRFALQLQECAAHDAAARAATAAAAGAALPAAPCCCGDPHCPAAGGALSYRVAGVPPLLLRALFLSAHLLVLIFVVCGCFTAASIATTLLPPDALPEGVCAV